MNASEPITINLNNCADRGALELSFWPEGGLGAMVSTAYPLNEYRDEMGFYWAEGLQDRYKQLAQLAESARLTVARLPEQEPVPVGTPYISVQVGGEVFSWPLGEALPAEIESLYTYSRGLLAEVLKHPLRVVRGSVADFHVEEDGRATIVLRIENCGKHDVVVGNPGRFNPNRDLVLLQFDSEKSSHATIPARSLKDARLGGTPVLATRELVLTLRPSPYKNRILEFTFLFSAGKYGIEPGVRLMGATYFNLSAPAAYTDQTIQGTLQIRSIP